MLKNSLEWLLVVLVSFGLCLFVVAIDTNKASLYVVFGVLALVTYSLYRVSRLFKIKLFK